MLEAEDHSGVLLISSTLESIRLRQNIDVVAFALQSGGLGRDHLKDKDSLRQKLRCFNSITFNRQRKTPAQTGLCAGVVESFHLERAAIPLKPAVCGRPSMSPCWVRVPSELMV